MGKEEQKEKQRKQLGGIAIIPWIRLVAAQVVRSGQTLNIL